MKTDSDLFDKIRVKPDAERAARRSAVRCEAPGCEAAGTHKAPKGRGREGQYHCFCLDHVRAYNKSYNYFAGMSDDAVTDYIRASATGHRPTWSMGVNGWRQEGARPSMGTADDPGPYRFDDPFGLFDEEPGFSRPRDHEPQRAVRNAERRSLEALNLDETARGAEIKTRFKTLVKRFHPDLNGGDRSLEDKLREIIQAYTHLKSAGLC